MTLPSVLAWSIARSMVVTSLAVTASLPIARRITDPRSSLRTRRWLTAAALLPLFVPELLIGFTYRLTSARLLHSVMATEGLYFLLLFIRVSAVQVAAWLILPTSGVSPESLHAWKLLKRNSWSWWMPWLRMLMIGPFRTGLIAWLAGALLCFQEFETAALLQIDRHPIAWTVWLFDAHAAGQPLSMSLRLAIWPLILMLLLLSPAFVLLRWGGSGESGRTAGSRQWYRSRPDTFIAQLGKGLPLILIGGSLIVFLVWPVLSYAADAISGVKTLLSQRDAWSKCEQILMSLLAAGIAGVAALQISFRLRSHARHWVTLAVILPGLFGSLIVSLVLLGLFQLPVINEAYDTWLPLLLGQTLVVLPRALLLVLLLEITSSKAPVHSAVLLTASPVTAVRSAGDHLVWRLSRLRWLLAAAVVSHWCFWDVTIASTLRPVRFEPVVTRLYNEMHYGRTETLVAITLLSLLMPLVIFIAIGFIWRQFSAQGLLKND